MIRKRLPPPDTIAGMILRMTDEQRAQIAEAHFAGLDLGRNREKGRKL